MKLSVFLASSVLILSGCSARTADLGETQRPVDPEKPAGTGEATSPSDPTGNEEPGETETPTPGPEALAAARAQCTSGVHGPVDQAAMQKLSTSIVGKWLGCSSKDPRARFAVEGIEFLADGTWHLLTVQDDQLVPAVGLGKEGTWEMLPSTPSYVYVTTTGSGVVPTLVSFETSPRRMKTEEASSGWESWLVPVEP